MLLCYNVFMIKIYKFFLILPVAILAGAGCSRPVAQNPAASTFAATSAANIYNTSLRVGAQQLSVAVANTDAALEQGLSGRQRLTDTQGMLFDMRGTGATQPGFWMKDMLFNLDFIWINKGRVIGTTPEVPAPQNATATLPVYYPPSPADMVLEVNAGWSAAHQVKTGDEVKF